MERKMRRFKQQLDEQVSKEILNNATIQIESCHPVSRHYPMMPDAK